MKEAARNLWDLGYIVAPFTMDMTGENKRPMIVEGDKDRWLKDGQTLDDFERLPWQDARWFGILHGRKLENGFYPVTIDYDRIDEEWKKAEPVTQIEQTKRGRIHLNYLSRTLPPNRKSNVDVELRSEGLWTIVAPSEGYTLLNDNLPSTVENVLPIYERLVAVLGGSAKHGRQPLTEVLQPQPEGNRNQAIFDLAAALRDKNVNYDTALRTAISTNQTYNPPLPEPEVKATVQNAYQHPLKEKSEKPVTNVTAKEEPQSLWPEIPEPIDYGTEEQLDKELLDYVKPRLDLTHEEDYATYTAMIKLTWILDLLDTTPYAFFMGPKNSGKTRALELLEQLCYKGFLAVAVTRATLYYIIDEYAPSLMLDETEIYTTDTDEAREIQSLLNTGYRRTGRVPRTELDKHGKRHLRFFKVFGFKALAGTRYMLDTLESRCIIFKMSKNGYTVEKLDQPQARTLRGKLNGYRVAKFANFATSEQYIAVLTNELLSDIKDERLKELFAPLLVACRWQSRQSQQVQQFATKMQTLWNNEAQLCLDAQVLEAIRIAKKTGSRFPTNEVTDLVNGGKREDEQLSSQTVGAVIRRLGFEKTKMQDGIHNGWFWDEQLCNRRAMQFKLEFDPQKRLEDAGLGTVVPFVPQGASLGSVSWNIDTEKRP